jgi:hypothetical protein
MEIIFYNLPGPRAKLYIDYNKPIGKILHDAMKRFGLDVRRFVFLYQNRDLIEYDLSIGSTLLP